MIHDKIEFESGVAHEFDPNTFYRRIKRQEGREIALRATEDLIIMLSCLRSDKTYKEYQDEWTDRD